MCRAREWYHCLVPQWQHILPCVPWSSSFCWVGSWCGHHRSWSGCPYSGRRATYLQRQTKTLTGKPVPKAKKKKTPSLPIVQRTIKASWWQGWERGQTFSESVLQSFFVFVFDTLWVKFSSVLSNCQPHSGSTQLFITRNGWAWEWGCLLLHLISTQVIQTCMYFRHDISSVQRWSK